MDAYEATRVVFSRIQALDPDNAAKIMGLLLIQDHGEKEMIRLAFGPESLVHSVVLKARKDLGLVPPASNPSTPSAAGGAYLSRQNSARLLPPPPPLTVSSPSWAPTPALHNPFSRSNGLDDTPDDLINGGGGADLIDELQLQDQLSFLNDPAQIGPKGGDFFYPDDGPYSMGGYHRRSCSAADLCLSPDAAAGGFGWKPCLYFARGYCKNGATCRFLHGLPDDSPTAGKIDSVVDQQCHELLLRSKSQRLMASAFPFSPTGSVSVSPSPSSTKCMNFLLQQQSESQRAAAAAAAAAALMLGGDDGHKFMGRARMERADFAGMVNPGSRQIYLTFPADSTFREEDVSNYFSIYGPVQDVRIPYQQKRMFGFVTFVYPETVKLILAKGNPHFVCDARVLVKPYKEKGKVPDKYRKQQQQAERGDFSGCTTPTSLDSRDNPYDLGSRMLYGGNNQDLLLRRKLEEQQQQQAAELQQAIELQGRRFMGLHLLDFKARSLSSPSSSSSSATAFLSSNSATNSTTSVSPPTSTTITIPSLEDSSPPEDKSPSPASAASSGDASHGFLQQVTVNASSAAVAPADKEESSREASPNEVSDFQESAEHNLPDSPFASPTKASFTGDSAFNPDSAAPEPGSAATVLPRNGSNGHLITSTLDMASFKSCFYQMPRFPSGHGAVGM